MAGAGTPPKYDPFLAAQPILEEAVELAPRRLTVHELSLRVVTDPDDSREIETAARAIRGLRDSGLFSYRDDDQIVEPTRAAICAFHLLTR